MLTKDFWKSLCLTVLLSCVCLENSPARAAPILVSGGEMVIFDWTFPTDGLSNAQVFTNIDYLGNFFIARGNWFQYGGLGATGEALFVSSFRLSGFGVNTESPRFETYIDGEFSSVLALKKASLLVDPALRLILEDGTRFFIGPSAVTVLPFDVPSPATIGLVAAGLISVSLRRSSKTPDPNSK